MQTKSARVPLSGMESSFGKHMKNTFWPKPPLSWDLIPRSTRASTCLWAGGLAHKETMFTESMRGRATDNLKQEAPFKDIPSTGMLSECGSLKIRPGPECCLVLLGHHCSEQPWNSSLQTFFRGPQEKFNSFF